LFHRVRLDFTPQDDRKCKTCDPKPYLLNLYACADDLPGASRFFNPEPFCYNLVVTKTKFDAEIKIITDQIVKKYKPQKIILFGSGSSGRVRQESDIDLLIIKDTKKKYLDRVREVVQITDSKFPTDIFVLTPKELERAILENRFMIIDEILPKGKVLYEKA